MEAAYIGILGTVIGVLLGWGLGIISNWISHLLKRNELKKMVFVDLENLLLVLSMTSYRIQIHLGVLSRASLEEFSKLTKDNDDSIAAAINDLLKLKDDELTTLLVLKKGEDGEGLALKEFSTPLLDASIGQISIFNPGFQKKILNIYSATKRLNEAVELSMAQMDKTFLPEAMESSSVSINKNIDRSYEFINTQALNISRDIKAAIQQG